MWSGRPQGSPLQVRDTTFNLILTSIRIGETAVPTQPVLSATGYGVTWEGDLPGVHRYNKRVASSSKATLVVSVPTGHYIICTLYFAN